MQKVLARSKHFFTLSLIAATLATVAMAQEPDATGGAALVSEPGKASVMQTAEISAKVIGIDKTTRTVTLKGPKGKVVDIVAGEQVRNFDQIKVGDLVVVRYAQALTLELKKVAKGASEPVVREAAVRAQPGERPAVAGAREVTALVKVVVVDPKASTITVRGPKGKVVTLEVHNPDQFKVVKQGDYIKVTYTEALALSVEPTTK